MTTSEHQHRATIDTLILEAFATEQHYHDAHARQVTRIRQTEASGIEASEEEYEILFRLEDAMRADSL